MTEHQKYQNKQNQQQEELQEEVDDHEQEYEEQEDHQYTQKILWLVPPNTKKSQCLSIFLTTKSEMKYLCYYNFY